MNIIHCAAVDIQGGAFNASYRLHKALQEIGVESRIACRHKNSDDPSVILLPPTLPFINANRTLKLLRKITPSSWWHRRCITPVHPDLFPSSRHKQIEALDPDVIHLHWITDNFFPPSSLRHLRKPVIWTMHDTWPFTGGCHCLGGCRNFMQRCGCCPQLRSTREWDLSRLAWIIKEKAYQAMRPVIVSPSKKYYDFAKQSGLLKNLRIEHIPNPVDCVRYRPYPKAVARDLLGLPQGKPLLLFGAMGGTVLPYKGFDLLCSALSKVPSTTCGDLSCIVFGSSHGGTTDIPYPVRYMGYLHDELTLALAYSAADVFACPSREDNFPNTVLEASACGTPSISFEVGGLPDMIEHQKTGWISPCFDTEHMAQGICWLLENNERLLHLGDNARDKAVNTYAAPIIANHYKTLYEEILRSHNDLK